MRTATSMAVEAITILILAVDLAPYLAVEDAESTEIVVEVEVVPLIIALIHRRVDQTRILIRALFPIHRLRVDRDRKYAKVNGAK